MVFFKKRLDGKSSVLLSFIAGALTKSRSSRHIETFAKSGTNGKNFKFEKAAGLGWLEELDDGSLVNEWL